MTNKERDRQAKKVRQPEKQIYRLKDRKIYVYITTDHYLTKIKDFSL